MRMTWLIARRELREIVRDSNLLIPLLLLPFLMGTLAGLTLLTTARGPESVGAVVTTSVLDQLPAPAQRRLAAVQQEAQGSAGAAAPGGAPTIPIEQFTVGTLFKAVSLPIFWIVAVALTPAVAADSFVGEKERGTIEPLLATPIRDRELFAGKLLTAVVPAIVGTWFGTAIFAVFVAYSHTPYYPAFVLADRDWLFSSVVLAPLLALLAAGVGALISTRVGSYRVAYQLNSLIVLPVVLGLIPLAVILFLLTPRAFVLVAAFLALLDVLVVGWAVLVFERERLLGGR